jgi:hypothetical protein
MRKNSIFLIASVGISRWFTPSISAVLVARYEILDFISGCDIIHIARGTLSENGY